MVVPKTNSKALAWIAEVNPRCGADLSLERKLKFVDLGARLCKLMEKPVEVS